MGWGRGEITYTHALPARYGTQWTQRPQRPHGTERRDVGGADQRRRQVDQRQLAVNLSISHESADK